MESDQIDTIRRATKEVRMAEANGFVPLRFERLSEPEMRERAAAFADRLQGRRSVRMFSPEPVPLDVIDDAIRAAGSAPSGANQQPWTFVVVTDPDVKQRLRDAAEAEERESYEHRMSDEWLEAIRPLGTDANKPHLTDAPALIVVFGQAFGWRDNPETGEREKVKHYYVQESVGIAVGMLIAALHHAGLATLTHTPSPMRFLREALRRPENERPFVLLPVGYPAADATVPAITKKPLAEIRVRI